MTEDYSGDVSFINDWQELVTQKRNTPSYNSRGESSASWGTVTTAYVDIQPYPMSNKMARQMTELGITEKFDHVIFGYANVSGTALSVNIGDRFYDASNKIYEVTYVKTYSGSHNEYYCINVTGVV